MKLNSNFVLMVLAVIFTLGMSNLGDVFAAESLPPELPVADMPMEEPTEAPAEIPTLQMTTAELCTLLGLSLEDCTVEALEAVGVTTTFPQMPEEWTDDGNGTVWRGVYGETNSLIVLPTDVDGDGVYEDTITEVVTSDLVMFEVVDPAQGNTYLVQVLLPNGKVNQHPVSQNNALKYLAKHDAAFPDTTTVIILGSTLPTETSSTDAQSVNVDNSSSGDNAGSDNGGNSDNGGGNSTQSLPEQSNAGDTPAAEHNPHITGESPSNNAGNNSDGSGNSGCTGDGCPGNSGNSKGHNKP